MDTTVQAFIVRPNYLALRHSCLQSAGRVFNTLEARGIDLFKYDDQRCADNLDSFRQNFLRVAKKSSVLRMLKSKIVFLKNSLHSRLHDNPRHLIYIHIGKCGGASLWDAIRRSEIVKGRFSKISKIHIMNPPIAKKSKYIIVVRNPISRAISAFNWRYYLVFEQGRQIDRFPGEYEVLKKYETLNNISEALYDSGVLRSDVAKEFRSIHHLREDISFYLSDLLDNIEDNQIFGVLATENLDDDVSRNLNVAQVERVHRNSSHKDEDRVYLSPIARENIKRFLSDDYKCIEKLSKIWEFDARVLAELLK